MPVERHATVAHALGLRGTGRDPDGGRDGHTDAARPLPVDRVGEVPRVARPATERDAVGARGLVHDLAERLAVVRAHRAHPRPREPGLRERVHEVATGDRADLADRGLAELRAERREVHDPPFADEAPDRTARRVDVPRGRAEHLGHVDRARLGELVPAPVRERMLVEEPRERDGALLRSGRIHSRPPCRRCVEGLHAGTRRPRAACHSTRPTSRGPSPSPRRRSPAPARARRPPCRRGPT